MFLCNSVNEVQGKHEHGDFIHFYIQTQPLHTKLVPNYLWNIPQQLRSSGIFWYCPSWDLKDFLSFLLYVVQYLATRGSGELLRDFLGKYFRLLYKQKL